MKRYDKPLAALFVALTAGFFYLAFTNTSFLMWAFERHQNQFSWYIRPLFIIPYCYFAYKQSYAGVFATVFLLFTSMFWFPVPQTVNPDVQQFLALEKEWLRSTWSTAEAVMGLTVPLFFFVLALAFWKRSLMFGLMIVVLTAGGKILWSVSLDGGSGKSVIVPAVLGLVLCVALLYYGFQRLERSKTQHE